MKGITKSPKASNPDLFRLNLKQIYTRSPSKVAISLYSKSYNLLSPLKPVSSLQPRIDQTNISAQD